MSRFWCDPGEEITSAITFTFKEGGKNLPLFCVDTYQYDSAEIEPANGRILVFATINGTSDSGQSGYQLTLLTSVSVKGCVYALCKVGTCIAAAVNSSVSRFLSIRASLSNDLI